MYNLRKSQKVCKNKEFQAVYKTGRSYANRYLVLYMIPVGKNEGNRIGFAAGKRLGGAVVRNRVKRLLREAYRLQQHHLKDGYTFVLVGRQPIIRVDLWTVQKALMDLFRKMKLIHEDE